MLNPDLIQKMLDEVRKKLKDNPGDNLLRVNLELLDSYQAQPEFIALTVRVLSFCEALEGQSVIITGPAREVALKRLQTLVGETRKWQTRIAMQEQFQVHLPPEN
jgi:hypothetical protein